MFERLREKIKLKLVEDGDLTPGGEAVATLAIMGTLFGTLIGIGALEEKTPDKFDIKGRVIRVDTQLGYFTMRPIKVIVPNSEFMDQDQMSRPDGTIKICHSHPGALADVEIASTTLTAQGKPEALKDVAEGEVVDVRGEDVSYTESVLPPIENDCLTYETLQEK